MARFDAAQWRGPIPNRTANGMVRPILGLVLHIQQGTEEGTNAWFHNPRAQASAHFGNPKQGQLDQWVDTNDRAWAQSNGNRNWISIENEGKAGEALTPTQLENVAQLLAWLHRTEGVPLRITDAPNSGGLGWHGMGGTGWGGHPSCLPLDITEVLTPNGWRNLADVSLTTLVASYAADSELLDFAPPLAIVDPYESATVSIGGLEMTADHRLYVHRTDGDYHKVATAEELGAVRTNWLIPASGNINAEGCGVGPDLMRLLVWVQADAHYSLARNGAVESLDWHLSKMRKAERIGEVLDALGKSYTLHEQGNGTYRLRVFGQQWIADNVLRWLPKKQWEWWLLQADASEFAAFDAEVCLADGHERPDMRTYTTAIQRNADVVQALYATHGRRAAKHEHSAGAWAVQFATKRNGYATRDTFQASRSSTLVGCLTTHNDTLLIRQHGRVAVVGNCPGAPIVAQRDYIVQRAQAIVGGSPAPQPAPQPQPTGELLVNWAAFLLGRSSRGQYVKNLQGLLVAAGRHINIDGDFGPGTEAELKAWQQAAGVPSGPSGRSDEKTWRWLLGWHDGVPNWAAFRLVRGARGQYVKNLQGLLAASGVLQASDVDGDFGSGTDAALRAWQKAARVPNSQQADGNGDGVCGENTWRWLLGWHS